MRQPEIMTRKTTLEEQAGAFDREFWANLSPEERMERVWTLSYQAWKMAGKLPGEEGRPRATARVLRA